MALWLKVRASLIHRFASNPVVAATTRTIVAMPQMKSQLNVSTKATSGNEFHQETCRLGLQQFWLWTDQQHWFCEWLRGLRFDHLNRQTKTIKSIENQESNLQQETLVWMRSQIVNVMDSLHQVIHSRELVVTSSYSVCLQSKRTQVKSVHKKFYDWRTYQSLIAQCLPSQTSVNQYWSKVCGEVLKFLV